MLYIAILNMLYIVILNMLYIAILNMLYIFTNWLPGIVPLHHFYIKLYELLWSSQGVVSTYSIPAFKVCSNTT